MQPSPYRYCILLCRRRRNFALHQDRRERRGDLLLARAAAAAAVGRQAEDRAGRDGREVGGDVILKDAVAAEVLERCGTVGRRSKVWSPKLSEKSNFSHSTKVSYIS